MSPGHVSPAPASTAERGLRYHPDTVEILRAELDREGWVPRPIELEGDPDPYPTVEESLGITRGCLALLAERRHPVELATRSQLVLRDLDLLARLAGQCAVRVVVPVESLIAPPPGRSAERTSPADRLHAIYRLAQAGVPVGVALPARVDVAFDTEMGQILEAAAAAGARWATGCHLQLAHLFRLACARTGLEREPPSLACDALRPASARQLAFL